MPCAWVDSAHSSYTIYTSGTTGRPKGVQRDTGGYAVALAASMEYIFDGRAGETYFSTSDIGWVVGHSYIVYGPLLAGMATILYEGLPIRPDAGVWWRLVERHRVTAMFSAPTAIRVLKKQTEAPARARLSSLRRRSSPASRSTSRPQVDRPRRSASRLIDNYWQTESGWPMITSRTASRRCLRVRKTRRSQYGWDVRVVDERTGADLATPDTKGVVVIEGPTPPGFMQTVWRDDARFVDTYWKSIAGRDVYNTFDWGIRDADGYFFILGRTDDVINVAGHRLGTREIEESTPAIQRRRGGVVASPTRSKVRAPSLRRRPDGRAFEANAALRSRVRS